jgi:hypothetical protein
VAFVALAPVVFRRANVPAVDAMRCHVGLLVGCDMCCHLGAWQGEGRLVEIEVAIETGMG